jgi:hypothetical protein
MASVEVVRALGGWLALPAGEDMVLVAALGELASGWHSPAVTWLYRHHEGQMTHDQSLDERCRELGVRASLQRVEALRHMRRGGLGAEFSTGE